MAKKSKNKKKIESKIITKKEIDKLLEDNNIVIEEEKQKTKAKLKRTKRNEGLYEKEDSKTEENSKQVEIDSKEEIEILDTQASEEIQEEILKDIKEAEQLEEKIEKIDTELEENTEEKEEVVAKASDAETKEESVPVFSNFEDDEMDTSFLTSKKEKGRISTSTFKNNYNVLITVIFVLIVIFLGFLIFHYTTFNHHKVKVVTKIKEVEKVPDNYLFLGDSITDYYDLDKYYTDMPTVNSGKSGNTTEDILKDMKGRAYQYNPSKVFLLIGTNDFMHKTSNEDIISNIEKIIEGIKENRPKAEIYLESIYPVNYGILPKLVGIRKNEDIQKINEELKKYCEKDNCTYIDMYDLLTDDDGNFSKDYTDDGLHPNDDGYEVITKELKKYIK